MAALAFSIAVVDAADDKKKKRDPNAARTIKGTLKCAKCALKKTEECQAALEITRKNKDGKETTRVILIKNDDVSKAFHKEICKASIFSAVLPARLRKPKRRKRSKDFPLKIFCHAGQPAHVFLFTENLID